MNNRLAQMMEPEQAQLVAQQVYDLARIGGVKQGNLTSMTLDAVFDKMLSGQINPLANPYEENISAATGSRLPAMSSSVPTGKGGYYGDLLPRTAMQSPIEAMRPARYFSTADGATDFLGTSLYRLIDSSTIGLLGLAGGLLKKVGVTEKNFWTESVGERQSFLGLDFGEGGVKGADTKAGEWGSRVGEFAGFAIPIIASGGAALAARGATSAAARASLGKMAAEKAGDKILADKFGQEIIRHAARAEKIRRTGQKVVDISNKLPANYIFEVGTKATRRMIFGEAVKGVQSAVLKKAAGTAAGVAFGVAASSIVGKQVAGDVFEKIAVEAAEKAAKEGAYAGAHMGSLLSPKAMRAAKEAVEGGLYEAPEVMAAAQNTFRARFAADVQKRLGIPYKGNEEFFNGLVNNASKAFDDAFKAARKDGGLMNLHEKVFLNGTNRFGVGLAKAAEHSASHVAGMVMMGAASRITHPLAEPSMYGVEDEDSWEMTKNVARYWLKGANAQSGGWSPFEGVTGDVLTGAMFATGGLTNLIPGLQKVRSKNPAEMISRLPGMGGTESDWKGHLDILDMELESIYKLVKKGQAPKVKGGIAGFIQSHLRRNHADFGDLFDTNPDGFKHVASKYLDFLENNEIDLPFNRSDILMAMKAHSGNPAFAGAADADKALYRSARDKIVDALFSHRKNWLEAYNKSNTADLLKDLGRFAVVTTATSIMSAPTLWKQALVDDNPDIHPADLIMHTMFSAMMARHPYYMDGASIYMPYVKKGRYATPEEMRELSGMRIRNALRHLGVRDSSLVLDGQRMRPPMVASAENPLAFDQRVNAAIKDFDDHVNSNPADPNAFTVTNDLSAVKPGDDTMIHTSEINLFADTLYQRWRSGAEIDETFLNKDKTGKPKVFEDTFNSFEELTRMAQVVGWLKRKMVAEGKMAKGDMFDPYKVIASEGEYLSQKIGDVSRALGVGSADEAGIIGRMNELVEPVDGHIRHIRLLQQKNPDGSPIDADTAQRAAEIIDGYNELVDIAGMLRKPIHTDENGIPLPELVDITSEKMESIRALVEESGKVVAEMLGIKRARLGRKGDLKNFIITGLVGAKTHQNLILSVDNGVLFTSDGDHIDHKSVLRSLIENGFGTTYVDDAGETQYILWPLNKRAIEGVAGSGRPLKADVIANLYRWLRNTKGVHVMEYKPDGKTVGQDAVEKFFSKDGLLYDARGTRIENRNGGLDAVLRDVGIMLDNPGLVKHMVDSIRERRRSGLSREVRELARLSELTDLFVYDRRLGKSSIAVPVFADSRSPERDAKAALADTTSEEKAILHTIIDDLPKEYQAAVAALGKNGWKLALSEDEYAFWRSSMQKLIDAGELTGFSARDTYDANTGEMTTPSRGTFVMIGDKGNDNLRALRSEIQRQMNRTVDETMKDIGEGIKILEARRAEIEGKSSLTTAEKRRLKLTKGMIKLFKKAQAGGYDYVKLNRAMISSGIVTIKDGKREWKLKFGTMKDLRRLGKDLKKFYQEDQLRAERYDFRTIRHMAEKAARDAILAVKAGDSRTRVSASEFFVASGLNMTDAVYGEALDAIEDVHGRLQTGAIQPEAAGAELRQMFDGILRSRLSDTGVGTAGSYLKDYKLVLDAVEDNYMLSIIADVMDKQVFREYTRVRGTTFPEGVEIPGGGAGDARKRTRNIGRQASGEAITREYLSSRADVSGASRDIRLAEYAKVAFLNPDGIDLRTPEKVRKLRTDLYTMGVAARMGERNTPDDTNSFVMLKDQSESDRYILVETPTDVLSATKLADQLDVLIGQYGGHIGSKDLKDAIENAKFVRDNLREAIASGDDDIVAAFSLRGELVGSLKSSLDMVNKNDALKSRMDLYADVFSLVRLHEYFGSHAVIDAFQRAVTDPDALPKLFTRSKLASTADDRRIMNYEFESSIRALDKRMHVTKFLNAGTPGMGLDNYLLNLGGVTINNNGEYHLSFYVYDSKEAQDRPGPQIPPNAIDPKTGQPLTQAQIDDITRTMKNLDGGILLNTHILKLLWHATGNDIFNPNTTYGLAKVRVLQVGPDGTLMTKDVMSADQGIMEYLEAANLSGIMSSEAAKVFSGIWEKAVKGAVIDYGNGDRDLFGALTNDNPGIRANALQQHFATDKLHIPVSALVWQHPVDGNPNHATRSPQITGFRSEKFTQAIVDIVDGNAAMASNVIGTLLGGHDSLSRMTQHAFFMDGKNVGLNANGVNDRYVEFGGNLATPMDYGGSKHYLNALKTAVFENYLFKIKTDNGTQEVYTVDTRESLASSEIVGGHMSGLKTTNLGSGMIAFEVDTPDEAANIVAAVNGYGARDNYYNSQPVGPEQEQNFTTNMAHVRITGNGKYDGIYLGLLRASQTTQGMSPKDAVPSYSATREKGGTGQTRTGAVTTIKLMRALGATPNGPIKAERAAKIISDAWQIAIKGTEEDTVVGAAVLRALDPIIKDIRTSTGRDASKLVRKIRDEIMQSRAELYIDKNPGEQVIVNNNVQRFRLHNALSFMFGSYNYYKTSRSTRHNKGHIVPFGLSVVSQRHPSTMLNDTFAMVQKGFLDINDGAQVKGYWKDMEDIAKGDQDEDHFHSWYDYSPDEIGEAMRLRMITGGFGDAKADRMPQISYFRSNVPANEKRPKGAPEGLDYDEVLSKRRAAAKAGIGLISKGIATGSAMLHKGVAFEMTVNRERILVAPKQAVINGRLVNKDERGMTVLDRTQAKMQDTFRGIAEVHNTYTDAKTHGSSEDPRTSDLQGFILSKFYGLWTKDPVTGEYVELKTSVADKEEALLALKGAASTLYRVSSFGKDVFTVDGRRKMNIYEMDHMSQRYNTIWGKEADTARALKHVMQIALSKEYIDFGKGRKARAISQYSNEEMQRIGESIHVVTDASQLKNRTVYDAMSEGVVKALDTIYSQDRTAYLTEEEIVGRGFGMEALAQADPSMRTAKTARFVANFQGIAPMAQELARRFSDGEELLGYEAFASAAMHKSGIDYMRRTQLEEDFDRGKRHTPRSPLERMIMSNNTADNLAVNVARAVAVSYDTRAFEADKRLLAAYGVQRRYNQRISEVYKQQYASAPEDFVDMDIVDAETRADIIHFLDTFGGADNMLVAALDLLTPTPDGYWFDRNNQEFPAYKNFKHAFFNVIQDHLFNGMVGDYGKLTPEMKDFTGTSLMELMAKARSTVSAVMSADSYALKATHDMIEVMATEGRSGASAIQFINLRSSDRQNEAKRNIFAAMIGRDFSRVVGMIQDAGFENPSQRRFGFNTNTDASRFLRDMSRDMEYTKRIRLNANMSRSGISQVRKELLSEGFDEGVTAISISQEASGITSRLENLIMRGEWQNLSSEMKRKEAEGKPKIDYNKKVMLVKKREEALLSLMLRSLDATSEGRLATLPRSAYSRGGLAQMQAELMLKTCI